MIVLMMVMAILTFVMFSVYDTQNVIVQRVRSQTAVDSAAMTAARWQVTTLNAIGEINLVKVATAVIQPGEFPSLQTDASYPNKSFQYIYNALDQMQARILMTAPLLGVLYAQQAAKLNGMHAVPAFAQSFNDLADFMSLNPNLYPPLSNGQLIGNTSYDYRQDMVTMLRDISSNGVAVLPAALVIDIRAMPPLPATLVNGINSTTPFRLLQMGIDLAPNRYIMTNSNLSASQTNALRQEVDAELAGTGRRGNSGRSATRNPNWPVRTTTNRYDYTLPIFDPRLINRVEYVALNLAIYRGAYNGLTLWQVGDDIWQSWTTSERQTQQQLLGGVHADGRTLNGTFKPQFNYKGADSVWLTEANVNYIMSPANVYNARQGQWTRRPENLSQVSWIPGSERAELQSAFADLDNPAAIFACAAAKPFGQLVNDTSSPPQLYGVVLPVFDNVRLIPIMFSSGSTNFISSSTGGIIAH